MRISQFTVRICVIYSHFTKFKKKYIRKGITDKVVKISVVYRNWVYLLSSSVVTTMLSFLAYVLLAKKMSVSEYGQFDTFIATITLFATFASNLSAGTVVNREIAQNPQRIKSVLKNSFILRTIGFMISSIVLVTYQYFTGVNDYLVFTALLILLFSNIFNELFEQISFGLFITKFSTLLNIFTSILWITFIIFVPISITTLKITFSVYSILFFIKSLIYYLIVKKLAKTHTEPTEQIKKRKLFNLSMPYFWMRIVGTLGTQIPILLLSHYTNTTEVAYYSIGNKFVLPMIILITTGINAMFPYFTKLFTSDKKAFYNIVKLGISVVFIVSSTLAALLTATSPYWLILIMGDKYTGSIEPFQYQVWLSVCLGVDLIFSMILSATYKHKALAVITTIDVVILMPFLLFSVNSGASGIALAKLLAALISLVYHILYMIFKLGIGKRDKDLSISILYFILLIMLSSFFENLVFVFIAILVYFTYSFLVKDSLLKQILDVFKKRRNRE